MRAPPYLARVQYRSATLWLPLVLFWPLLALSLVPLFLLGGVAVLFLEGTRWSACLAACSGIVRLLCELPGTRLSLDVPGARFALTLY